MNYFGEMLFIISIFLLCVPSEAYWRHLCHGELGLGRMDPLMSPGKPSQHVHIIQGSSNFGFDPTIEELMTSNCTSCSIAQDKSVYWSPQLYFEHDNGTFQIIPKVGGLTVYYFSETPDTGDKVTAFPQGFRMIAGNSNKRAFYGPNPDPPMAEWKPSDMTQQSLAEKELGFNCLNYENKTPEGSLEYHTMRPKSFFDTNCPDGMRAEIEFPSCWNGVDLDSDNHTTHVAYPSRLRNGPCPSGYPVRLPSLFYETIFDTYHFKDFAGQFVFANGDPTGNGYHGDFIAGWDDGILQQAIDDWNCTTHNATYHQSTGLQEECPVFTIKNDGAVTSCKMQLPEQIQSEKLNLVQILPGNVPVQSGPEPATFPVQSNLTKVPTTTLDSARPAAITGTSRANESMSMVIPITAAPTTTTSPCPSGDAVTETTIYFSNGEEIHSVHIEQVQIITVTEVLTTPTYPRKRHLYKHQAGM